MLEMQGKKAIVTGGTSGIGKAIALLYAQQGADVVLFGTSEERAREVISEMEKIRSHLTQYFSFQLVEVSKTKEVQIAIQECLRTWNGQIDVLVNCAGITRDGLLLKMSEEDWDRVIEVNLKSVYNTSREVIRSMIKARSGRIINVSSVVGLTGNAGQVNYASSKAAIIGFTKSLAKEVASRNICVNCIAPGYTDTKMTQSLPDSVKEEILGKIPLGRMGSPMDIAFVALFLASPLAQYMTGQVLAVDGGMTM